MSFALFFSSFLVNLVLEENWKEKVKNQKSKILNHKSGDEDSRGRGGDGAKKSSCQEEGAL